MTDKLPVRATGPADLLALVPSLLGFHPEDSVVVLTVGDATQPFHARVDLPTDPVGVEDLAAHLAEVAARNGVTRLAVVVYSDDAGLAEAVTHELDSRLLRTCADLVCAVRADGERWWPLAGRVTGRVAGPVAGPGTAYDVGSHPLMAQAVMDGTVVLGNRQELADTLVGSDPDEADEVAAMADEVLLCLATRQRLVTEGRWVRDRVCRFLDDGERLDSHDVARLATLVTASVEIRDVAWAEMDHDNAGRHVDLWRDVVRRVPVELRAASAALLGFAAWLSGHGALAWCAVDCAQDAEPGHSLAGLLTQALAGALPPSVWRPFPRDALTLFAD